MRGRKIEVHVTIKIVAIALIILVPAWLGSKCLHIKVDLLWRSGTEVIPGR
jgi:hypothetical protein